MANIAQLSYFFKHEVSQRTPVSLKKMIWITVLMILYASVIFDGFYASELVISRNHQQSQQQEMTKINNIEPVDNLKTPSKLYKSAIRAKLREIFASQYPRFDYSLRAYEIENWPPGIHSYDTEKWSKSDLIQINEMIPYIRFVPRKTFIEADYNIKKLRYSLRDMECLTSATLNYDYLKPKMMKMIFERFRLETGRPFATRIDWDLLDRSQIPEKYNYVPLKSETVSNQLIYKNPEIINNIHFYRTSNNDSERDNVNNENVSSVACSSILENKETTFPLPHQLEDVNSGSGHEDELEIDSLFDNYLDGSDFFEILYSDSAIVLPNTDYLSIYSKSNESMNLNNPVESDCSVTMKDVHKILLERYREETGEPNAPKIKWKKLDRSSIPAKYNEVILNGDSIRLTSIYRNPEIIDNIHFYRLKISEKRQRKRKLEDDCDSIYEV